MSEVLKWLNTNLLTINVDKTHCVPFSLYKNNLPGYQSIVSTDMNFEKILISNSKYLGIYIDCHLKWDQHILQTVGKIRKLFYLFKNLREFLNIKHLK